MCFDWLNDISSMIGSLSFEGLQFHETHKTIHTCFVYRLSLCLVKSRVVNTQDAVNRLAKSHDLTVRLTNFYAFSRSHD